MTTYIIVSKDQVPLGPNELHAGQSITVNDGDIFIIDPSADANITFASAGPGPTTFDIQVAGSNSNTFDIKVGADLTAHVGIADNADLSGIKLDATASDALTLTAGDNVSFGQMDGSTNGPNTITLGDGFFTDKDWKLGGSADTVTVGDDATFKNIDAGAGNDTIVFGDRAKLHDMDTKAGNDSVTFGDDLVANAVKTSDGNDTIRLGVRPSVNNLDGGSGYDTLYAQDNAHTAKNIEQTQFVCYAPDTRIDTPSGPSRVADLTIGDLVDTQDAGPCAIRWIRSSHHALDGVATANKPILIGTDALGPGLPGRDLIVSPQHRILVGGHGQLETRFDRECFVPAKALTGLPGIRQMRGKRAITWVHFALDRHHVIRANGLRSESLYLGPMVVQSLTPEERSDLHEVFACRRDDGSLNGPAARPFLTVQAARRMLLGNFSRRHPSISAAPLERGTSGRAQNGSAVRCF
ncbi:Hint domain-containing protein [uncultured Marivita sp.]|uniref:Hint domain-containing protein n=1 Tax=uncultured Marivita sp. TaxID=888080 RepID=UPI00260E8CAB|nr:Hint domain-containing protein [uncultured Marivita sp.]